MSDLDSFFAKKDKKKGKSGKKFTTTEEIAKKLEDFSMKKDKGKKDKSQSLNPDITNNGEENEDEWKEFQEDKKDYSGLKLQHLVLNENDQNDSDKNPNDSNEEGQDGSEGGKKANGPWKIKDSQNEDVPVVSKETPLQQAASKGTYVHPVQKQILGLVHSGERSKTAPDMNSTVAFPTLQSAQAGPKPAESVWNKRMETIRLNNSGSNNEPSKPVQATSSSSSNTQLYRPPHQKYNN